MTHLLTIEKNISEHDQARNYQNGTLQTAISGIAMTIDTHIEIPDTCTSEADIENHLVSILSVLEGRGVTFNILLGPEAGFYKKHDKSNKLIQR
jgi:hypothetical protein